MASTWKSLADSAKLQRRRRLQSNLVLLPWLTLGPLRTGKANGHSPRVQCCHQPTLLRVGLYPHPKRNRLTPERSEKLTYASHSLRQLDIKLTSNADFPSDDHWENVDIDSDDASIQINLLDFSTHSTVLPQRSLQFERM